MKIFEEFLVQLEMQNYMHKKLTLKNILNIKKETMKEMEPQKIQDIPWHFLMKLVALDCSARSTHYKDSNHGSSADNSEDSELNDFFDINNECANTSYVHPLDVVCVLLHCSDHFLQQEIVSKMSMCQFAIPLLLPAADGKYCTLMLWAMRDIVKRWRPHSLAESKGFKEDNVVNVSMSTFSFVRLGKTKLSKSKILNQVLSQAQQQQQDFFIHDNMEGGNIERKITNGLVEMSWYFPSGRKQSDIFPEPIAVTNLRGDLESNFSKFRFLTRVSSAVFIFIESIRERDVTLLSICKDSNTKYYFIITPSPGKDVDKETFKHLRNLMSVLNIEKNNIIIKKSNDNEAILAKNIQCSILKSLSTFNKKMIQDMDKQICGFSILLDEKSKEICKGREHALKITREINDVIQYKRNTMVLQGDLWTNLSVTEKEMCRMKNQGGKDLQSYQSELIQKRRSLHQRQYKFNIPSSIMTFINAMTVLSQTEKQYFLKWMKFNLDSIARSNLSVLQDEYKQATTNKNLNKEQLKQLDQKISDSSLGIEHFLREMGQFFEAECSMLNKMLVHKKDRQYTMLPGMAVDLLLDGFPLELIDGDASNIPLHWISEVLTELDTKTGGQCRMRVITVLGVQSSGKSTLLNTMFGLQFPVASGRCTRGAFMTLIRVEEDVIEELGCDFIMVIDTEGLKAIELASLEDSYEHDNEMATLVIGLSDITIINIAMENTTEMKDILQIVVHAFLRMEDIRKKPKCQFVHQNVNDVSADEKLAIERNKFLKQLDEMTQTAAKMERKHGIKHFTDVMDYDIQKDNWYISNLWHGVPPMASVNHGYSEKISELKMYLFELIKLSSYNPHKIGEFITLIKSMWNAVKYETFIFSFRNSLVAEAYNKLSIQFSQWEWDFTKVVYTWVCMTETLIKNQTTDMLQKESYESELNMLLHTEEKGFLAQLTAYFEAKDNGVKYIEKYREDFSLSVKFLRQKLERYAINKCHEAMRIKEAQQKINNINRNHQKEIEKKVTILIDNCRKENSELSDAELNDEFNNMWKKTISDFQIVPLQRQDINQCFLQQLRNNMSHKGSEINRRLSKPVMFSKYGDNTFQINRKHYHQRWYMFLMSNDPPEVKHLAHSLIESCRTYVTEKINSKGDYDNTYCEGLLHLIDNKLKSDTKQISTTLEFELDIKLCVLGDAVRLFQKMHNDFIQENDPEICLDKLKDKYLSIFREVYCKRDDSLKRAKEFCENCLKPAITEYIHKHLGTEIVGDMLDSSVMFKSRSTFQANVLEDLLKKEDFKEYVKYINSYKTFLKNWIFRYICDNYRKSSHLQTLQRNVLLEIIKKINVVLNNNSLQMRCSIKIFLEIVCEALKSDLVISLHEISLIAFENNADVAYFSSDVQHFLKQTEKDILSELKRLDIETILPKVTVKPEDELLQKVIGCGKQCPFCKVPCEAGGSSHTEHAASIHRSRGLGQYRYITDEDLNPNICSTSVFSNGTFRNRDTNWVPHPNKEYRKFYPDWHIQPDPSIESSDYWKYLFVKFNEQFAEEYKAKPAILPKEWREITKEQALRSLKEVFNMQY